MAKLDEDARLIDAMRSDDCYHVKWCDTTVDYFPVAWFKSPNNMKKQSHKFLGHMKNRPAYCDVLTNDLGDGCKIAEFDYSIYKSENNEAGCSLGKVHLVSALTNGSLKLFYKAWTWLPSGKLVTDFDDIGILENHAGESKHNEGDLKLAIHKVRERFGKLRKKRLELEFRQKGKIACNACGFDFSLNYKKEIGKGYAEVHHIEPLQHGPRESRATQQDLAVLCANCHRMIHKAMNNDLLKRLEITDFATEYLVALATTR